jgi:hypothetical protein
MRQALRPDDHDEQNNQLHLAVPMGPLAAFHTKPILFSRAFRSVDISKLARLADQRDRFTADELQRIGQWELELKEHLGAILQRHGPRLTIVK